MLVHFFSHSLDPKRNFASSKNRRSVNVELTGAARFYRAASSD